MSAFTFRAYPLGPQVFAGSYLYSQDRWHQAWAVLDEWTKTCPTR